jgi:hypothetical protein
VWQTNFNGLRRQLATLHARFYAILFFILFLVYFLSSYLEVRLGSILPISHERRMTRFRSRTSSLIRRGIRSPHSIRAQPGTDDRFLSCLVFYPR